MQNSNLEIRLLVKGRPITEFSHEGKTFVEGRSNSEFEIEVRNRNAFRIEAVISVDGLSITDGKAAGSKSTGYLLEPYGSIRIPGWKLNSAEVAKFVFAGRGQTYADAVGDSNNNGIVGLMAYREKAPVYDAYVKGLVGGSINRGFRGGGLGGVMYSASSTSSRTLSTSSASTSATADASTQNIGTGFGDATGFATRTVSFERDQQLPTMLIYYDDLAGLKARGVPMERVRKVYQPVPQAFPADTGCVPPPGWQARK